MIMITTRAHVFREYTPPRHEPSASCLIRSILVLADLSRINSDFKHPSATAGRVIQLFSTAANQIVPRMSKPEPIKVHSAAARKR